MIRDFREDDARGVAAVQRVLEPDVAVTEASLLHRLATEPERARLRYFVAEEAGEIVGWARARLSWETESGDEGIFQVGVRPDRRRRGLGTALYEAAERHLSSTGATKLATVALDDAGERFLEGLGFDRRRSEEVLALDPRAASLSRRPVPAGMRLVPLRDVLDRTRELHRIYVETSADIPADEPETNIGYEEWVAETLESPLLDRDGSFVALDGEEPVAFAFLFAERERGVAEHDMTGTVATHRRRGLGRLVKEAAIGWAAENGIQLISTANDTENVAMQRLNESLGYRHLATHWEYGREV